MRLLLDTNILIDFISREESSGFAEPDMFETAVANGPFLVSVVSLWEIEIKTRIGKLSLQVPLAHISSLVKSGGGFMLELTEEHVLAKLNQEPVTKDPFDRLLLATASSETALLVTRDHALQLHPLTWRPLPLE